MKLTVQIADRTLYITSKNVIHCLQSNRSTSTILTKLLDTWNYLQDNDQSFLVEAVEQLSINTELSTVTLKALQETVDKLKPHSEFSKIHAMVLVQNKFLSLYSSRNAQELSSADILFIIMLCLSQKRGLEEPESDTEEYYSPSASPVPPDDHISYQLLLMGTDVSPKCLPHTIHIHNLTDAVNLVVMIEGGNNAACAGLYESFLHLTTVQNVQVQRDIETLRPAFENLDLAIKKTSDGLKKFKNINVDISHKKLLVKWDFMRKKYHEFAKTGDTESILRVESCTMGLLEILRETLSLTSFEINALQSTGNKTSEMAKTINDKLQNFSDFLKVKALKNFSLGSYSLTINKYLEEFPGLVHFIYIDRTNHRVTAPSLDFNSEETITLTKKKIWSMVKFSRSHLQQGTTSIMWKDTTFNYAYFLWFEDRSGSPLRPKIFPTNSTKALPQPGILCGDFYLKLIETCFPKMPVNKVRCFELFCIHLGLATSSCVLEQTRRLAATIWEVTGVPNNPIDLL